MDIIQAYNSRVKLVLSQKVQVFNSACDLGTLSKEHSAKMDTLDLFKDKAPRKPDPISGAKYLYSLNIGIPSRGGNFSL